MNAANGSIKAKPKKPLRKIHRGVEVSVENVDSTQLQAAPRIEQFGIKFDEK